MAGIGIHPKNNIEEKNSALSFWLAEPFWVNGIITQAIKEMLAFGFKTYDISKIFARPLVRNIGSQKVLEKAGSILEVRFEQTF